MRIRRLLTTGIENRVEVDADLATVFDWHARPGAMTRLTPPFLPFSVIEEASSLADGTAVLGLPGGLRWTARHEPTGYVEGRRFVDTADLPWPARGRTWWQHVHEFEKTPAGGTLVRDTVTAAVPTAALEPVFAYRNRQLVDDLAAQARMHRLSDERLTVAVTGASGLVGGALCALLTTGGHRVIRLVRGTPRGPDQRRWRPQSPDEGLFDGVDVVVHLAGASIAGRFTQAHKEAIRNSRVLPTQLLAEAAGNRPFVCASAIGLYGTDTGDLELTETSSRGDGFLADVVQDWEGAASQSAGRVVQVRTGIVQSAAGGALALQRPLFEAGLGGPLGSGEQWLSWIALDDLVDIYHRAIVDERVSGPVNAVAPNPVRNRVWARTMGAVLHRPAFLPVPAVGPRLLLGEEGSEEMALASQRVVPDVLAGLGHVFRFPTLPDALRHELGRA